MFMDSTREDIIGLDATHSELCRFDVKEIDQKLMRKVLVYVKELYTKAVGSEGELDKLPEIPAILPRADATTESTAQEDLERRLDALRHGT
jgi:hypothetical protein